MIRKVLFLGAVGMLLLGASAAYAFPPIDLTVANATVTGADGVIWTSVLDNPTGTGVIDPFLRFQKNGVEEGMNTDGNAAATYDDKASIYTHSVQMGSLATVVVGGQSYYEFFCDINEVNSPPENLLSLDQLKIYTLAQAGGGSLTSVAAVTGAGGVLRYNMDATVDQTVYMDYNLNAGSGQGDIKVLIPTSYFAGVQATDYMYFYNMMGATTNMGAGMDGSDGFEEWRALEGPQNQQLPEPSTVMILGTGLLGLAATRIRRK
ncbi:MAG: PEP-CTERM sorting domain-containing protein [Bacteroidota bacterium]